MEVTSVAEKGLLDKAMGLVSGVSKRKRVARPEDMKRQLSLLQKNLAKLVEDVEKLGELVRGGHVTPAKTVARSPARPSRKRAAASRSKISNRKTRNARKKSRN
jgi:hypothetical protein